jgi:hypothetical protein
MDEAKGVSVFFFDNPEGSLSTQSTFNVFRFLGTGDHAPEREDSLLSSFFLFRLVVTSLLLFLPLIDLSACLFIMLTVRFLFTPAASSSEIFG